MPGSDCSCTPPSGASCTPDRPAPHETARAGPATAALVHRAGAQVPLARYIRAMRAGVVLGLVAGLALSGCSSSAAQAPPRALPTPSASATPVASPSPSATATPIPTPTTLATVPAAAQPTTPQGAAAFVKFFFVELNVAFQSGETGQISRLSDPMCGVCSTYVTALKKDRLLGKHIVGESFGSIQAEAAPAEGEITFVTVSGVTPRRRIFASGELTLLPSEGQFRRTVALIRVRYQWIVRAVRFDS